MGSKEQTDDTESERKKSIASEGGNSSQSNTLFAVQDTGVKNESQTPSGTGTIYFENI